MRGETRKADPYLGRIKFVIRIMAVGYLFFSFMPGNRCFAVQEGMNPIKADLVWVESDGKDFEIYYTYFSHNAWQPKVRLSNDHFFNIRPSISSGSDGSLWAVWSSLDGSASHLSYSYFDGASWTPSAQISTHLSSNATPSVFIDQNNIPWIVWTGFDGQDDEIYFTRWNGDDWDAPEMINRADSMPDVLPVIGISPGNRLYVRWLGFDGKRYRSYVSKWTGTQWEDEAEAENAGSYQSMIKSKADLIPDIPAYITEQSQAAIHIRGMQEIQSIRLRDIKKISSVNKNSLMDLEPTQLYSPTETQIIAIAFGDSITQGVPYITSPGDGRRIGGYEPDLEALLKGPSQKPKVLNYGAGGEDTTEGLNRIDSVLNAQKAALILIMEGTNDIFNFSRSTTYSNLRAIVDKTLAHHVTTILATLSPDIRVPHMLMKNIPHTYNPEIKKIANEKGVKLAEMYDPLFNDWASLSVDGLHPNREGYREIAKIWSKTMTVPDVRTSGALAVDDTTATVSGIINPNHFHTRYWFEYGWDTTYGGVTAVMDAGSGSAEISVSADLSSLSDDHEYHYRLVASNDYGKYAGGDQTFQTLKSPDKCFIATAAFGSPLEPSVVLLRVFRDKYLLQSALGRAFVKFYYQNSPRIAELIVRHKPLKRAVRVGLYPLVGFCYLMLKSSIGAKIAFMGVLTLLLMTVGIFWFRIRFKNNPGVADEPIRVK